MARGIVSVRIAGNVATPDVLASAEYGCAVAQAKWASFSAVTYDFRFMDKGLR
ncbi:MAG: hypothetical protein KF693_00040 [Nitrospira sp.]|nr:hypothetical protein [Nitrospira sp.]